MDTNGGTLEKTEYHLLKTGDTTLSLPTPTPPEDEDVEFLGWVGTDTELELELTSPDSDFSQNGKGMSVTSNTGIGYFILMPTGDTNVIQFNFDTDASSLLEISLSLVN